MCFLVYKPTIGHCPSNKYKQPIKIMTQTTDFGFQQVNPAEKTGMVRGVFERVAGKYDIMNDILSFGMHRLWKDQLLNQLRPNIYNHLLDLAGGTGDIALGFVGRGGGRATICDLTPQMVGHARVRADNLGYFEQVECVVGNGEHLPFAGESFDCATIGFGLRNITNKPQALAEIWRVLQYGGRFFCLEFSRVNNPLLAELYNKYSFHIMPKLGKIFANSADSYQYLAESIRMFPPQEELAQMMRQAGFQRVSYQNLSSGIVAIHYGVKLP